MGHSDAATRGDRLNATARVNGLPEPPLVAADTSSSVAPHQQRWHAWEQVDVFTVVTQAGLQHHVLLRCPRCGQYWARSWNHRA